MFTKEIREADVVITLSYRNGMSFLKNRDGEEGSADLIQVLESIVLYQKECFQPLLLKLIEKLKLYRVFS